MLFRHADALAALTQLEHAGADILGADQFKSLNEDGIQPIDTIDVSSVRYKGEPYPDVRDFIARGQSDPDTVYELIWN